MSKTAIIQSTTRKDAFPDNTPGPFYINTECIICSLCSEIAPDVFRISEDGDHFHVHNQPSTKQQMSAAEEALEACPLEAIIKDDTAPS